MSRSAASRQHLIVWRRRHDQDDIDAIESETREFLQAVIRHRKQEEAVEQAARDLLSEIVFSQVALLVTEVAGPLTRPPIPPPPPSKPAFPRQRLARHLENKPLRRGERSLSRPLP